MTTKPNAHWLFRARLAHERLVADGGEQTSDPIRDGYQPEREVAQYRLMADEGHITEAEFEAAKERLLEGEADA